MKKLIVIIAAGLMLLSIPTQKIFADGVTDNHTVTITLPSVALLDIEPAASKNISMTFTAPTEAGLDVTFPSDNTSLWLNYSSIVASSVVTSRHVTVTASATFPGADFQVTAAAASGDGAGTKGTSSGAITLSTSAQTCITGIGSCWTGDGAKGHNLTYHLGLTNYSLLMYSTPVITVTYTLVDN